MKLQKASAGVLMAYYLYCYLTGSDFGIAAGNPPEDDLAIKGYDTVAYFKASKALKGNESFTFKWHDMTWYFSTKENRDLFAASPEKYAPQYDGYCAWH